MYLEDGNDFFFKARELALVQLSLVFQNQHLISHEENGSHLIINDFGIPEHAFTHILLSGFPQETATKIPYPLKQNKTKQKQNKNPKTFSSPSLQNGLLEATASV